MYGAYVDAHGINSAANKSPRDIGVNTVALQVPTQQYQTLFCEYLHGLTPVGLSFTGYCKSVVAPVL